MGQAIQFAYFVQGLDPEHVRSVSPDYELTRGWTTSEGAQVLLPETEAIQQAILDLVSTRPR
jgi:hypothetical protein